MKRILLILALVVSAGSVDALTLSIGTRSITAEYTDVAGQIVATDTDSETVFDDAPYTRALSATIGGGGYNATIGMSSLGFFGIDALTFVGGRLETRVLSLETYENDTAVPVDLEASFLVVEGLLQLVAATGGTLTLDIQSGEFPFGDFRGIGQLDSVDFVSTYTETGDPRGGTQAFPGAGVSGPVQQNVIDLGLQLSLRAHHCRRRRLDGDSALGVFRPHGHRRAGFVLRPLRHAGRRLGNTCPRFGRPSCRGDGDIPCGVSPPQGPRSLGGGCT